MTDLRKTLAVLLVGAFIGAFPMLLFKGIPEGSKELIAYMIGQLSGMVTTVVAFHFGSTTGGEAKTKALADAAQGKRTGTMDVEAEEVNIHDRGDASG